MGSVAAAQNTPLPFIRVAPRSALLLQMPKAAEHPRMQLGMGRTHSSAHGCSISLGNKKPKPQKTVLLWGIALQGWLFAPWDGTRWQSKHCSVPKCSPHCRDRSGCCSQSRTIQRSAPSQDNLLLGELMCTIWMRWFHANPPGSWLGSQPHMLGWEGAAKELLMGGGRRLPGSCGEIWGQPEVTVGLFKPLWQWGCGFGCQLLCGCFVLPALPRP